MKSIVLPAGTEHVLFGDLAHLIADALWPDAGANDDRMTYACARINFDGELARAVKSGALPVKDPLTLGQHTFPIGDALNRALVTVDDLREFVAGRGLSVLFQFTLNEDGGSTTLCATQEEYDAMAAGKQAQRDERHKRGHYSMYEAAQVLAVANSIGGAEAFLKNRMRPAVESGALVLLDPIDGGPVTGRLCRPHDDWVTPKAIDEWLAGAGFTYRWPVAGTATQSPPVVQPTETKEQRQDRRLRACIDAGLPMNDKAALLRLPDGVGDVADRERVTRQSFSTDVKAALERRERAKKDGLTVHRA